MFEKEAEEWTISHVCKDCSIYEECKNKERCTCKECSKEKWQNGAWFGYNKFREELNQTGLVLQSDMDETIEQNIVLKNELNNVKEWHYVKDGKYPAHSNRVLVFTDEGVGFGIYGLDNKKWYTYDTGFDVIAWKEIILPKKSL